MRAFKAKDGARLAVERFKFPDGQEHVKVEPHDGEVRIEARIRNGNDLLALLLAEDAFRTAGATWIHLVVEYLLAARMDRPIATGQPFSLKVVADLLRPRFDRIEIVDPHSPVACQLLDAEPILPLAAFRRAVEILGWRPEDECALCAPDAGAAPRVFEYAKDAGRLVVQCLKKRDPETGRLSGFRLAHPELPVPKRVLICDDLCDGGGTFAAVGGLLREHGAEQVSLFVTHGILSKDPPIPNIDRIFITNTCDDATYWPQHVKVLDWRTGGNPE